VRRVTEFAEWDDRAESADSTAPGRRIRASVLALREAWEMSEEGSWGDYVTDAGTDPVALDIVADGMTDAATEVVTGVDAIDTPALPDDVAAALGDASYNATEASSWADWAQGGVQDAAEWQDSATDHLQAAQEWAESGNLDAAAEEIAAAQTASGIAEEVLGQANTDLSIGAEYMDASADSLGTAAYEASSYDASSVDTSSIDTSTYDSGSVDVSSGGTREGSRRPCPPWESSSSAS
jgi:hypothetical protein